MRNGTSTGKLWIGGGWQDGDGPDHQKVHPFDGSIGWKGRWASSEQVDVAIQHAKEAFQPWAHLTLADRIVVVRKFAEVLEAHRSHLNRLIACESGKPLWEADSETTTCIGKVQNSLDAIHQRRWTLADTNSDPHSIIRYRPMGVMMVLGPFNLPAHLPGAHIVPALLAGNTIVFKPSEQAPAVGEFIAWAWQEAGLPPNVLQMVQGAADVAQRMVASPDCNGVLFTGSYRVGCAIHRALAGRPEVMLALEMGGNNALVVDRTSDVESAVYQILLSAFITSGQRCTCARRLILTDEGNGEEVLGKLQAVLPFITAGDPLGTPSPFLGSLISEQAAHQMLDAQSKLLALGGKPLVEMRSLKDHPSCLSPGLIDMNRERVPDEEWFGPLLVVQRASDLEEAVRLANDTRFGLSAGLISDCTDAFHYFVHRVRAGIVNWNRQTTGASGKLPFGGIGASGNFRPSGSFAADYCSFPVASLESESLSLPPKPNPGLEAAHKYLASK